MASFCIGAQNITGCKNKNERSTQTGAHRVEVYDLLVLTESSTTTSVSGNQLGYMMQVIPSMYHLEQMVPTTLPPPHPQSTHTHILRRGKSAA